MTEPENSEFCSVMSQIVPHLKRGPLETNEAIAAAEKMIAQWEYEDRQPTTDVLRLRMTAREKLVGRIAAVILATQAELIPKSSPEPTGDIDEDDSWSEAPTVVPETIRLRDE